MSNIANSTNRPNDRASSKRKWRRRNFRRGRTLKWGTASHYHIQSGSSLCHIGRRSCKKWKYRNRSGLSGTILLKRWRTLSHSNRSMPSSHHFNLGWRWWCRNRRSRPFRRYLLRSGSRRSVNTHYLTQYNKRTLGRTDLQYSRSRVIGRRRRVVLQGRAG